MLHYKHKTPLTECLRKEVLFHFFFRILLYGGFVVYIGIPVARKNNVTSVPVLTTYVAIRKWETSRKFTTIHSNNLVYPSLLTSLSK